MSYYQWCFVHNKPFTIKDLNAQDAFCYGCWKTACMKSILQCLDCCTWTCTNCMTINNLCKICDTIKISKNNNNHNNDR